MRLHHTCMHSVSYCVIPCNGARFEKVSLDTVVQHSAISLPVCQRLTHPRFHFHALKEENVMAVQHNVMLCIRIGDLSQK